MIKPIRNQILVKPFPSDDKSIGGIIVSDAHKAISNKMKVVSVGNGLPNKPMKIKEGDTVFRVLNWGIPIEVDDELHFIMDQDSLLATL
jgi:chaperonin GroES